MITKRKKTTATSKTVAPRKARTAAGQKDSDNLPAVSRQTAGGIAGAALGGLVAGPLGSVVAGVAGALVGNASAAGDRPVERTVEGIRAVAEPPIRRTYKRITDAIARHRVSSKKKAATKKAAAKKTEAKETAKKAAAKKVEAKETAKKDAAKKTAAKALAIGQSSRAAQQRHSN